MGSQWVTYGVALLCVGGLAAGQILFKLAAMAIDRTSDFLAPSFWGAFGAAVTLYGVTSVAWVWVLQRLPLGRAYPLMALAFILVPAGSHVVFGEQFPPLYMVGVLLIVAGLVLAVIR